MQHYIITNTTNNTKLNLWTDESFNSIQTELTKLDTIDNYSIQPKEINSLQALIVKSCLKKTGNFADILAHRACYYCRERSKEGR